MALVWSAGFLRDSDTGYLATTTDTAGARPAGGFLRAPDGRLVVRSV